MEPLEWIGVAAGIGVIGGLIAWGNGLGEGASQAESQIASGAAVALAIAATLAGGALMLYAYEKGKKK
jgi:hypothetical protein